MTTTGRGQATAAAPTPAELRARRVLASQEGSGWSQREFARRSHISASTLAWWKHEIARRDRSRATAAGREQAPVLVPVRVVGDARAAQPPMDGAESVRARSLERYEVVLHCGRVVRVPREFDAPSLQALIGILEAPTC